MRLIVFCGPSLRPEEGRGVLEATFLPPAQQGDLYRALRRGPVAMGLIDGLFDQVNAVAHKEILWAMSQGVHVLGGASMGALRAAELESFGMEGVGSIFEDFQRGRLEDDDEVAVLHGSAEDDYRPLSEPMVNIRATLAAARTAGVVSPTTEDALLTLAKALFYPDRAWPTLLARAREQGLEAGAGEALGGFVRSHRVDQKREDALRLLGVMRERFSGEVAPKTVRYHFSHTDAWQALRDRVDAPE